jgi:peptidase S41-like protein
MLRHNPGHRLMCFTVALLATACSSEDSTSLDAPPIISSHEAALRDMTADEAREDLETIISSVENRYGAYEYKEALFGYSIAELEDEARELLASSPGDDGFYTAAKWFLTRLQDGHVTLRPGPRSDPVVAYAIGLDLQAVQDKALIFGLFDSSLADLGIERGDEVVSVDGVSPLALLDELARFETFGNERSDRQFVGDVFYRPSFATSLRPVGPTARVELRRGDGSEYTLDLIWRQVLRSPSFVQPPAAATSIQNDSFLLRGDRALGPAEPEGSLSYALAPAPAPFFFNPATIAAYGFTPATPSNEALEAVGIDPDALPNIFSAVYTHQGKKLLLIRQPTYDADFINPNLALAYYRALLSDYESSVDGLVVDQTHNLGGSIQYCLLFFRLFSANPTRDFLEAVNTDRGWIDFFDAAASEADPARASEISRSYALRASVVEAAYDAGQSLTRPIPLFDDSYLAPFDYVWKKPLLVLVDELSASAGDMFPMLVQANHVAPLFGQRTMGLGGNVELVSILPHSNAQLRLSRGLVTAEREDAAYAPEDFIENRGVKPEIEHEITIDDFRAGFVDYVRHFSDQIVSEIHSRAGSAR